MQRALKIFAAVTLELMIGEMVFCFLIAYQLPKIKFITQASWPTLIH